MTVTRRIRSPGRARNKPLKPLRAGMPGDLGWTCGDYARVLCFKYCTRGYGCGGHPAFPTPSVFLGEGFMHHSGASRRGNAEACMMNTNAPDSHTSSPRLTGRPSIPETPENKSTGR